MRGTIASKARGYTPVGAIASALAALADAIASVAASLDGKASLGTNSFSGSQSIPTGSSFVARNENEWNGVEMSGAGLTGVDDLSTSTWSISSQTGVGTFTGGLSSTPLNVTNATSGTLANARTTATASANANTVALRNASGSTAFVDVTLANTRWLNFDRTVPTTVGTAVALGSFALTNGGSTMTVQVTVSGIGYAQAKAYSFPTSFVATNSNWLKVEPAVSTGAYSGNDADLEINLSNGTVSLRLRRIAGTTAATAKCVIQHQGYVADTWTASTTTTSSATTTGNYEVFAGAILTSRLQLGTTPSDLGSYSLLNWNGSGQAAVAFLKAPTVSGASGGSTILPPEPAQILGRSGIGGTTYPNFVEQKVGRYEHSASTSRTIYTLALTHGNGDAAGTDVLSLYSNGRWRMHIAAPPASATAAGITGEFTWGDIGGTKYFFLCVATNTWVRAALATW